MEVIVTCMTCMFAVALALEGPIRRQATQTEQTVPIGGNVTLLCPFVPDATWVFVYWKKNDQTIYSLDLQSNTPTTNNTRYEGSNHATRLTIKDLQKTDSGIYRCKVASLATTDFIKEGGQVQLSVTDQDVGMSTSSPDVSFRTSTTVPPQPAEYTSIFFVIFLVMIPIFFIFVLILIFLNYKYRNGDRNLAAGYVSAFGRLVSIRTSIPLAPDSSYRETRDETSETGETGGKQLPLVGLVLIDDQYCASASNLISIVKRMRQLLHFLVEKYKGEGVPPKGGEYSASLTKYASSGNRFVPKDVLEDVEYFLDELDHIPVGRKRDVCEILLTMPENLEVDTSTTYSNKDIFLEYDQDDQESAVKREHTSRTTMLEGQMRSILRESETRDAARNYISLIILDAPVEKSGSASLSQQAASRYNQSAKEKEQETSFLSQSDEDSKREEDNLIKFWLSKVIKLDPAVQRRVSDRFDDFDHDAESSSNLKVNLNMRFNQCTINSINGIETIVGSEVPDSSQPSVEQLLSIQPLVPDEMNSSDSSQSFPELHSYSLQGSTSSSTPSLPGSSQPTNGGGTKPCLGSGCKTCTLVIDACEVTGPSGGTVKVEGNFICRSKCVIYYIHCDRCSKGYVGKTTQKLQDRMSQHCRDIKRMNTRSSVANHFNLPGHNIENLRVCVLKRFPSKASDRVMKEKEMRMVMTLETIEPKGMNKV